MKSKLGLKKVWSRSGSAVVWVRGKKNKNKEKTKGFKGHEDYQNEKTKE